MFQYLLGFITVLAACIVTQTIGLKAAGGRTTKCESNYFSTLARVQTQAESDDVKMLLLGSSLTGRIADRAVHFPEIGNLGCDGGSAMVTLRAIDQGHIKPAPLIVVEMNTLAYDLMGLGSEIEEAIDTKWFKIGRKIPNLGATARPTEFAYSWLMEKKFGKPETPTEGLPINTRPRVLTGEVTLSTDEQNFVTGTCALLSRIRENGSRILLVMLPPGEAEGSQELRIAEAIAIQSKLPYWDLNLDLPKDAAGFTDGRHMDAETAGRTLKTLRQLLE